MLKPLNLYRFKNDEQLVYETHVYTIGIAFPEKVPLKLTQQHLIYQIYREDKVIRMADILSVEIKDFKLIIHHQYGTKSAKISFITAEAEQLKEMMVFQKESQTLTD